MATSGISSSTSAANLSQLAHAKSPAAPERATRSAEEAASASRTQQQQASKGQQLPPVVNDQGQTTGRIVNITA